METKPVLAFDCSTSSASIALWVAGDVRETHLPHNRHAALLMSEIDALMREANLPYSALGTIITTVGPGSFTGVRIGLAALHGMALAHSTPVKTLTSLEALAWEVAQRADAPAMFFTGLRAGKGEAYMQAFTCAKGVPAPSGAIFLCPEAKATTHAPYFGNLQPEGDAHYLAAPNAGVLCRIAAQLHETGLGTAYPTYIRAPDAAVPAALPWLA